MTNLPAPTALIAEDEPLLAAALRAALADAWPELRIVETVGNGAAAIRAALAHQPDLLFFDIRMPGIDGLQAAEQLADEWPAGQAFPLLIFVTAYDEYAIAAFERAAVDYLLKPVSPQRLARTCERLRAALQLRRAPLPSDGGDPLSAQGVPPAGGRAAEQLIEQALEPLRRLLAASTQTGLPGTGRPEADSIQSATMQTAAIQAARPPAAQAQPQAPAIPSSGQYLRLIPASTGQTTRMIPIDEVLAFEAADKYVLVVTTGGETPIRTPLKELLPQLDPDVFWQIHRGTVVRADAIESAVRDDAGRLSLRMRGLARELPVSRVYAQRFRPL